MHPHRCVCACVRRMGRARRARVKGCTHRAGAPPARAERTLCLLPRPPPRTHAAPCTACCAAWAQALRTSSLKGAARASRQEGGVGRGGVLGRRRACVGGRGGGWPAPGRLVQHPQHNHAHHNTPLQAMLVQLREDDEMAQLAGLTELCEYLSISTEEALAAFPTEQVVPLLVRGRAWGLHAASGRVLGAGVCGHCNAAPTLPSPAPSPTPPPPIPPPGRLPRIRAQPRPHAAGRAGAHLFGRRLPPSRLVHRAPRRRPRPRRAPAGGGVH